jgi:hypothetical protein
MGAAHSELVSRGEMFQARLTALDVADVAKARDIFNGMTVVTTALYYLGTSESAPKFPATISWTIRKGLPKKVNHLLWTWGWWTMYGVFARAGDGLSLLFILQMFATGIVTTCLAPVGQGGGWLDQVHFVGALLYMLDHIVLFYYLGTTLPYRAVFYCSFVAMAASISAVKRLGLQPEQLEQRRDKLSAVLPARTLNKLYWCELVMCSENLMFTGFITGMASGLPAASV